jgi:hypothetical protein
MSRILRSRLSVFLLISLLGPLSIVCAAPAPNAELEGILRKIEARHYRWIAIQADVLLFFVGAGGSRAMCGGELLYQRLDERIFLSCVDSQQELVFTFRTLDRRFDLYLPAQNTVYHGSIFDLEDSPDIESHLKARDLYRALKPMAMDPRRTKLERTNAAVTSLNVYGLRDGEEDLVRKLYLTPEGDVRGEIFYDAKGRSVTEIQRYDFRELRDHVGSYDSVIFPKKITISSPETKKGSAIFFAQVKAMDTIDPLEFILRVPYGTKEVFLDEKDPRYRSSKTAPAPPAKAVSVYLATPLPVKKPAAKETRTLARKEKPKTTEPAAVSPSPVPANTAAEVPVAPTSTDQPSLANNQTALDPSVEPTA